MNYIFCFLFLMGISGAQGQNADCPKAALDCPSICACHEEGKTMNTRQIRLLNKECHMCGKGPPNGRVVFAPHRVTVAPQSKENAETPESDEDN